MSINKNNKEPEVSVVVPTYNRAKYVTKAIDSVIMQNFTDYEVIVVDDGSTDNTKDVLRPYMSSIKYIFQNNKGVSAARNAGIKRARGKWIAFLDSDDWWHRDKLKVQINFMNKNNVKVCFTNYLETRDKENHELDNENYDDSNNRIIDNPFDVVLYTDTYPRLQTMIVEKSIISEIGGFDEKMQVAEDTKIIHKMAMFEKFGYIDRRLTMIDRNEDREGLLNRKLNTIKMYAKNHLEILEETYENMPKYNRKNNKQIKRMLSHYLSANSVYLCLDLDYSRARKYAMNSIKIGGDYNTLRRAIVVLLFPRLVKYLVKNKRKVRKGEYHD